MERADKPLLQQQASIALAQIQKAQGDNKAAMASYQRVGLYGDIVKYPETRELVETALLQIVALAMNADRYNDVLEACARYGELFPRSPRLNEVRRAREQAQLKAASTAAP